MEKPKRQNRLLLVGIVVLAIAAATILIVYLNSGDHGKSLNIRLTWLHQAQFAGIYAAEDQGYYSDQGVNVSIKPGGIEYSSVKMVSTGTDDIGLTSADQILLARAKGVPLVALAALYQKSPVVLFSLKKSNITRPEDLRGKKIGIKYGDNTEVPIRALLQKLGFNSTDYEEVAVSYDPAPLLDGRVDVLPGFALNEPISLQEKGQEINVIYLADNGINFYADVIFTRQEVLQDARDLVAGFLRATLHGYEYAIGHPEDAVAATLRRSPEANAEHERNMLNASIPLWKPQGSSELGVMDIQTWEAIQKTLLETRVKDGSSLLKEPQPLTDIVNMELIRATR